MTDRSGDSLHSEISGSAGLLREFNGMQTTALSMLELFEQMHKAARADVPVYVWGETGTGKELTARAIHRESDRVDHPFVSFNCANFSEHLMESQLFGHIKGSFTGAVRDQQGLLGAVGKGTLFLDEVTSMDVGLQSKLLRVLQEREFTEVGSIEPQPFKGQIISAGQMSLEEAVQFHRFRDDLRYRLEVISIHLPPLRQRREDVMPLFQQFLRDALGTDQDIPLEEEAQLAIERCFWPGNIRQLQNTALYAKAMFDGEVVRLTDLPANVARHISLSHQHRRRQEDVESTPARRASDQNRRVTDKPRRRKSDRKQRMVDMSREQIEQLLARHRGVRARVAKELGVSRMTLWRAMKRHNLLDENEENR